MPRTRKRGMIERKPTPPPAPPPRRNPHGVFIHGDPMTREEFDRHMAIIETFTDGGHRPWILGEGLSWHGAVHTARPCEYCGRTDKPDGAGDCRGCGAPR